MTKPAAWFLLVLGGALSPSCWAQSNDAIKTLTSLCKTLSNTDFTRTDEAPAHITSAEIVEQKDGVPSYCGIQGYVWPQVGFELRLPTQDWNGKFIQIGCGGPCGGLGWTFWCPTHRGYACIVSDMGHTGGGVLWARDNLQTQIDFGYRSTHVVAIAGKAITERYYGRAPEYTYFHGCSTGSRQALIEAQRFPWDFDGIIAGGVQTDDALATTLYVWISQSLKNPDGRPLFSRADVQTIHDAVLAKCDLHDGVKDGLVGNPLVCSLDPEELRCKRRFGTGCLTEHQVKALNNVYSGPSLNGVKLFASGAVRGSELHWIDENYINSDGTLTSGEQWSVGFFRWIVPFAGDGRWRLTDFSIEKDYRRSFNSIGASLSNANNPDLRKFKQAGGKLMLYHGWNDMLSPGEVIDYFQTVERTMGGRAATQDFVRLFMVPGMGHCTGGEGAFAIDYLSYMEAWVERGRAPDKLIGAHAPNHKRGYDGFGLRFPLDPSVHVTFTRPVYPYPLWSKYKGSGDPNNAENFMPAGPIHP